MRNFHIKKVAVLGAGVMGAQIAAHLTNASVKTILFDLAAKDGPKNGVVLKAIDGLAKLEPSPVAAKSRLSLITPANYDENLAWLGECDLVIEAISERMDWKKSLYEKVAPHLRSDAIFTTNTSGLSIGELAKVFPEAMRHRFCGVHFFNPPRYMKLLELIPTSDTDAAMLNQLETFFTSIVGKGVIRAKDTPNFVANRVGVFSMLATMHHTAQFQLRFDVVDALTGPAIGRAKSATYRTADVVGLDTLAHVIKTMTDGLPKDPWHAHYQPPAWLMGLIAKGALGAKTKAGVFTKKGKDILVLDIAAQDYRLADGAVDEEVAALLKIKKPAEKFAALRACAHPQAQFLWAIFRDVFHYVAVHLADIAHCARDVDLAIRWGFGWKQGPFEIWQAAGWQQIAQWIAEDIAAGKTMANVPLPAWVSGGLVNEQAGVHAATGSYSAANGQLISRSTLPVYQRQLYPELVLGERADLGTILFEDEGLRLWTCKGHEDIAIASLTSKMHTLGVGVLASLNKAIDVAEADYKALVIWQSEPPFAAGANLAEALDGLKANKYAEFEALVALFQRTSQHIKYSHIPVISALDGMALGGGCEFIMHSDRVVATLESYVGLVEVGVGLLPAGGGLKEIAVRAALAANGGDVFPHIQKVFKQVAMGEVSKSALEAKEMGYLRWRDPIIFNRNELLYVALETARAMANACYRPPLAPTSFPVAGVTGIATLKMMLINMKEGGFISEHDYDIASRIATCLCGGEVDPGAMVDEEWMLRLERMHFNALARTNKTQERIVYMLKNGKPLRN